MKHILLAAALALSLGACATIPRFEAASDVHALLVSVRDGDRASFDAHIDRSALKAQLKSRLIAEGQSQHGVGGALAAFAAGPLMDVAADALLRPEVFRAIAIEYGYDPAQPIPNAFLIGQYVTPLSDDRACVATKHKGGCVLILKNEGGTYKVIGFEGRINLGHNGRAELAD